jgi:hypothetical protein
MIGGVLIKNIVGIAFSHNQGVNARYLRNIKDQIILHASSQAILRGSQYDLLDDFIPLKLNKPIHRSSPHGEMILMKCVRIFDKAGGRRCQWKNMQVRRAG